HSARCRVPSWLPHPQYHRILMRKPEAALGCRFHASSSESGSHLQDIPNCCVNLGTLSVYLSNRAIHEHSSHAATNREAPTTKEARENMPGLAMEPGLVRPAFLVDPPS